MGLSVCSHSSSHAPLCAHGEDKSRARSTSPCDVQQVGESATVISEIKKKKKYLRCAELTKCALFLFLFPPWVFPHWVLSSPSSSASTFVKWLPHPVGPEAVWSLICYQESPETRCAPPAPGCAPLGSHPSHHELWRWT